MKQTVQDLGFMAGQYAFFQMNGDKEVRLPFSVKLREPNNVVLPKGDFLEMPYCSGEDLEQIAT